MKRSDRQIRKRLCIMQDIAYDKERLQTVVQGSKLAFYENEAEDILTGPEFLYQQAGYIHKRWWVVQGILLTVLWMLLRYAAIGNYYTQRLMGIAAPMFVILLLPELWKNRTSNAVEIEGAAYYSLRQIYSARLYLFALADALMLSVFLLAAVRSGGVLLEEILIQFFLPLVVTCCICFHTLYSKRGSSEVFSMFLCVLWSAIWLQFMLSEKIYGAVAMPVWYAMLAISLFYLMYCICRGQRSWKRIWEEKSL